VIAHPSNLTSPHVPLSGAPRTDLIQRAGCTALLAVTNAGVPAAHGAPVCHENPLYPECPRRDGARGKGTSSCARPIARRGMGPASLAQCPQTKDERPSPMRASTHRVGLGEVMCVCGLHAPSLPHRSPPDCGEIPPEALPFHRRIPERKEPTTDQTARGPRRTDLARRARRGVRRRRCPLVRKRCCRVHGHGRRPRRRRRRGR
jgi:hypothetical protein